MKKKLLLGIGNIYHETNYLGLETKREDRLSVGHEYRSDRYQVGLGGSVVNFLVQVKNLGMEVGLVGKIGEDEAGEKVTKLLKKESISTEFIVKSEKCQTSIDSGLVLKHSGDNIQVVSGNANQTFKLSDINLNSDIFDQVKSIYLGGFFKQESLYRDYPKLVKELYKKGIKIFFDHGRLPVNVSKDKLQILLEILPFVEGYFQNRKEIVDITGVSDIDKAVKVALKLGPKFVAVKLGKDGSMAYSKIENIYSKGHKVKVLNVVGAGDSFNAAFITHYLSGSSLQKCSDFANKVASIKVSKNIFPNLSQI
ncbi:carbohydrate kinase family protein [Patescibacteria group bacterium]